MTPCKSLVPWVLRLVQESYLLYIDAIIDKNQSATIKNRTILHTFFNIWDLIDVSRNLNSNLAWIYWLFLWTFDRVDCDFTPFVSLFCHKFAIRSFILLLLSLVMETNSFTRLKLLTPISNLKLKKWSPIWTFYPYLRSSPGLPTHILLYITVAEVPAIFTDADTRIKRVKIGDHKNQINFADNATIFLKRHYLLYQNTSDFKTIRSF